LVMKRRAIVLTAGVVAPAPSVALAAKDKHKERGDGRKARRPGARRGLQGTAKVRKAVESAAGYDNPQALDKLVNAAWEIGGRATASAQTGDKGAAYQGAVSVSPGVWLYQVSGDSLALEGTAKGTKSYKDSELN
jgi:hypothetical protein